MVTTPAQTSVPEATDPDAERRAAVEELLEHYKNAEEDWEAYRVVCEDAAVEFMDRCSLVPTPDAVKQLTEAFLPCLGIICSRGYEPNGAQWRAMGWRGLINEMWKRMERLVFKSWDNSVFDDNAASDMINFAGYYKRLRNQGQPFGKKGNPGSGK